MTIDDMTIGEAREIASMFPELRRRPAGLDGFGSGNGSGCGRGFDYGSGEVSGHGCG